MSTTIPLKSAVTSLVGYNGSRVHPIVHDPEDISPIPLGEDQGLFEMDATIPGYTIPVSDPDAVTNFLIRELSTGRLQSLYKLLFLVSNRQNISPLHHQIVKDRKICISERPDHHLVWHYKRIFIKPLPQFLLSHAFCRAYLHPTSSGVASQLSLEARGFLRTYSRLIVYESDFDLALRLRLVPEALTWKKWCNYIADFQNLRDRDVALRYHYGEIRLTRLNTLHAVLYGQSYSPMADHYSSFFSKFATPYLFIFAAITVVLTAIQTGLEAGFEPYHSLASWLVPMALGGALFLLVFFPFLYFLFLMKELYLFIFYYQKLS